MSALAFSHPIPFVNPDDMEDTGAMILALVASNRLFDSMADTLADDLAKYRARCDAALARTQEAI